LCTAFGRWRAGALVLVLGLGLVVACGGARNGCSIGVVGVGVGLDGVAAATGAGVEEAGSVGDGVAVGIVKCVGIAVDGLRGQRGVSNVGSVVGDKGVR